jgi:hypothetical protein
VHLNDFDNLPIVRKARADVDFHACSLHLGASRTVEGLSWSIQVYGQFVAPQKVHQCRAYQRVWADPKLSLRVGDGQSAQIRSASAHLIKNVGMDQPAATIAGQEAHVV